MDADLPFILPVRLGRFALRVLRAFRDNNGMVLAAALAYNALLALVPLVLVGVAAASSFIDADFVVSRIRELLAGVVQPALADPITRSVHHFMDAQQDLGPFAFGALLFFSVQGFRVLQQAIDVVFRYRHLEHAPRPLWASALISLAFVAAFSVALSLELLAQFRLGPAARSEDAVSLAGGLGTALLLAAVYHFMPVGRVRAWLSLVGGVVATLLLQGVQAALSWYFQVFSPVDAIYGSIAGVVVVLLSLNAGAAIVMLGAQVIAEIERSAFAGVAWHEDPPRHAIL